MLDEKLIENLKKYNQEHLIKEYNDLADDEKECFEKQLTNLDFRLLDKLEEHDDVQNVYANFDIPDEIAEQCNV